MSHALLVEAATRLRAEGVVGPHQSHTRANNLSKIRSMLAGDPDGTFGMVDVASVSEQEALTYLARLTGCSDDFTDESGCDVIDGDRTVAAIVAAAERLRDEARRGALLLAVTGHPTGLLEHHIRVVDAYRGAGGKVLRLGEETTLPMQSKKRYEMRYVGGVGCVADWGSLKHTHSATPMEALLELGPWPDIVLGDHGLAGAAIERGIRTIAVMDINDPAIAVAWGRGKDVVVIPMDDNRPPRCYEASWMLFEEVLSGRLAGSPGGSG